MKIVKRETDHCEDRLNGARPEFIIIHYTETENLTDAEDYFMGRKPHPSGGRVSTHYMIDFDGTVYQYVDEDKRAWHAGVSHWAGVEDINSSSIGIELVNPGRKYGYRAFTAPQMDSLVQLCKGIIERHSIVPARVLGHSDVAPGRKKDPGELFDWEIMADAGIGVFPQPEEQDYKVASDYVRDPQSLREAFIAAGYDPKAELGDVIVAFQRHYYREAFGDQDDTLVGRMNETAAARLHWLVRNRPTL